MCYCVGSFWVVQTGCGFVVVCWYDRSRYRIRDLVCGASIVVSWERVGEQRYTVEYTTEFQITPEEHATVETGTPIVVRIPAQRCEQYGIDAEYDGVYWRFEYPRDAFREEIERNLATKYRRYYDREPPECPYFTDLTPKKEVTASLYYEDSVVQTIGTTWELEYDCHTRAEHRLMRLAYSAGLGELNTTGFGFINDA